MQDESAETEGLLDGIMDGNLSEVEAAPEFIDPPSGKYQLMVKKTSVKAGVITNKAGVQRKDFRLSIMLAIAATIELADSTQMPAREGDMFSISYLIGTKNGQSYFKSFVANFVDDASLNSATIGELIEALQGVEFSATVKCTTSMANGREFTNVRLSNIEA